MRRCRYATSAISDTRPDQWKKLPCPDLTHENSPPQGMYFPWFPCGSIVLKSPRQPASRSCHSRVRGHTRLRRKALKALLLIDIQNGFCPGTAQEFQRIRGASEVITVICKQELLFNHMAILSESKRTYHFGWLFFLAKLLH